MKKLLLGSLVLLIFSTSILIFQISCQKEVHADPAPNNDISGVIIFTVYNPQTDAQATIWTANTDGSNLKKIPIDVPADYDVQDPRLTKDGKTVIFAMYRTSAGNNQYRSSVYSCSIGGGRPKKLINLEDNEFVNQRGNVY